MECSRNKAPHRVNWMRFEADSSASWTSTDETLACTQIDDSWSVNAVSRYSRNWWTLCTWCIFLSYFVCSYVHHVFHHLQWISLHDIVLIYQGSRPNSCKQTSSTRPNTYCNHEFKQLLGNVHLCWPHLINQYHTFPWIGGKIRGETHLTHNVPIITHAEMMPTCLQVN